MNNSGPDHSEIEEIERRLKAATKKMHQLAPLMGAAETVISFASDHRKNFLAAEQKRHITNGESVAASEIMARSSPIYLEKLKSQEEGFTEAQRVKYEYEATRCSYDAARSLLARQRETIRTLPE